MTCTGLLANPLVAACWHQLQRRNHMSTCGWPQTLLVHRSLPGSLLAAAAGGRGPEWAQAWTPDSAVQQEMPYIHTDRRPEMHYLICTLH